MCGIVGVQGWTDQSVLEAMLSTITHRGPDGAGEFFAPDADLMMGARRLAIVDVGGGDQPISNEAGDVTVVFNGEIYNYPALRQRLEDAGHRFETDCDTEVLVHLWEEYGERLTDHLNGMFAFSLWDETEGTLFLARDHLGIKPLFYARTDEAFVWGSEMAALLAAGIDRSVDEAAVYNYFSLNYSLQSDTLFEQVEKLQPGTSLTVTEEGCSKRRFWQLDHSPRNTTMDTAAETLREKLQQSVSRRMMADVPVGAFLSGGLDSSAIVGLMTEETDVDRLKTFSIGFEDDDHDESESARAVSDHFGTDHHEIQVDLSSMDVFGDVIQHYGEPLADPAALPTLLLSQRARDEVKVVLSGEGADELLGGYQHYRAFRRHRSKFERMPTAVHTAAQHASTVSPIGQKHLDYLGALDNDETAFLRWARGFGLPPEEYLDTDATPESTGLLDRIGGSFETTTDRTAGISTFDLQYYLPDDLLYKVDHMSMAASLEARVPFLDPELVSFVYNTPSNLKVSQNEYKPLLKRAVGDIVPDRVLQRDKHGLSVPVSSWFEQDHEAIAGWLTEENLKRAPYISAESVFDTWQHHRTGREEYGMTLWKALNYVAWHETFVVPE